MWHSLTVLCIFSVLGSCFVPSQAKPVEKEKVRPYQFGFTIDEQQHRYEKRDERGIVMGEFGFITADGIYHVTVYATDEEGKFRILAMKSYPYESPPKTIDMIVKPKAKPPVVTTTTARAIVEQKPVPKHNFYNEACSGCFLGNGSPKSEDPKLVADRPMKTGIRTLSKPLGPEKIPTATATPAKGKVNGKDVAESVEGAGSDVAVTKASISYTNTPTTEVSAKVSSTFSTQIPTEQQYTPIKVSTTISGATIVSPSTATIVTPQHSPGVVATQKAVVETAAAVAVVKAFEADSPSSESSLPKSAPTHTTLTLTRPPTTASQKPGTEPTTAHIERLATPTAKAPPQTTTTSIVPVDPVQERNSLLRDQLTDSPTPLSSSTTNLTPNIIQIPTIEVATTTATSSPTTTATVSSPTPITTSSPIPTIQSQTTESSLTTIQAPTTILSILSPTTIPISTKTTLSPTTLLQQLSPTNLLSPTNSLSPTTLNTPTILSSPTTPTQSQTTSSIPSPTQTTDHTDVNPDTNLSVDFNLAQSADNIASSPAGGVNGFGASNGAQTPTGSAGATGSKGPGATTTGTKGPGATTTGSKGPGATGNKGTGATTTGSKGPGATSTTSKGGAAPQTPSTNAQAGAPSAGFGGAGAGGVGGSKGAGGSNGPKGSSGAAAAGSGGGFGAGGRTGSSGSGGESGDLYRFKYTLDYNGHSETGSRNGNKEGKFFALGDDNVERTIEYIANEFGFQPRIRWRRLDASNVKPKENSLKDYEFVWFKKE